MDEPITSLERQLRDAVNQSGLSLNEIERRCGVSHTALSRFVRGERSLTLPVAGKLCQLLGLDLTEAAPKKPRKRKGE
jgi:transcriptional regulator with XRE-family HTH domain